MSSPAGPSPATSDESHVPEGVVQQGPLSKRSTEGMLGPLYRELRDVASRCLADQRPDHTLQPTALVHEAYLRLARSGPSEWSDRKHFLATAARVMRHVLVDHARAKRRTKRGGSWNRVELGTAALGAGTESTEPTIDPLVLDQALRKLSRYSERQSRVVEMRFFAGLSDAVIAEVLGVAQRTVERDWRHARAWLWRSLERT